MSPATPAPSTQNIVSRQVGTFGVAWSHWSAIPAPPIKPVSPSDDEELAVGAVVCLRPGVPVDRVIPVHLAAGSAEVIEIAVAGGEAADCVDDDADFDPGTGAFGERLKHLEGDVALEELVELEVDGVACTADGLELGGVETRCRFLRRVMPEWTQGPVGDEREELDEVGGIEGGVAVLAAWSTGWCCRRSSAGRASRRRGWRRHRRRRGYESRREIWRASACLGQAYKGHRHRRREWGGAAAGIGGTPDTHLTGETAEKGDRMAEAKQGSPVWFITGCSTGFGKELAKVVLGRGWRAVVTARPNPPAPGAGGGAGERAGGGAGRDQAGGDRSSGRAGRGNASGELTCW